MPSLDVERTLNMLLKEIKNIYHSELDTIYKEEEVDSFFYLVIEHYLELERFALCKLARPGHDHHNLDAAFNEVLG